MPKDCSTWRVCGRGLSSLGLLVALVGGLTCSASAQRIPPRDDYRTITTESFRVTFPAGLAGYAWQAAQTAERVRAILDETFLPAPEGRIDVLLTDHSDLSNGFAEVFPSNRITFWIQPPLEGLANSHFDDWLELVVTHELVHVFQLDHPGAIGKAVRSIFGRVDSTWPAYSGYTVSRLGIEGVAVYLESAHTPSGRIHGTFHDAIARTQALAGQLESPGRALGRSPVWPAGDRPYVFGSLFFQHLSETRGEAAVARFFEEMSDQWIPYRLNPAATAAFGQPFDEVWRDWVSEVEAEAFEVARRVEVRAQTSPGRSGTPSPEILTGGGRLSLFAAPRPGGTEVAYLSDDGRNDTRLMLLSPGGEERSVGRWNSMETPSWSPEGYLLVPQVEYLDSYRIYRDLFRVRPDGQVTRVTEGLRVVHADSHPSSGEIIAVLAADGENELAILSREGEPVRILRPSQPGILWSRPAWSPDGELIAVASHRPGGRTAVVVLDSGGNHVADLVDDRSLNTAPTWTPDGSAVIWASDRSGIPNLYASLLDAESESPLPGPSSAAPLEPEIRQVTDLATGGSFPAVDSRAEWLYLSVLTAAGWQIARVPFNPASWFDPLPVEPRFLEVLPPELPDAVLAGSEVAESLPEPRPYSALRTILPRYWLPVRSQSESVLGTRVLPSTWGVRTSGRDLVGRHSYELRTTTSVGTRRSRTEWDASYTWAGLGNPLVSLDTEQEWDTGSPIAVGGLGDASSETVLPAFRERWIGSSVRFRLQRMRHAAALTLGGRLISRSRRVLDLDGTESERFSFARPTSSLAEARLSFALSTARAHAFSVSLEDGLAASVALRKRWDRSVPDSLVGVPGGDGAFQEAILTVRGYRGVSGPGFADHVLAFRAAVGLADGPGSRLGHFGIGGEGGDGQGILGFAVGSGFRRFPVRGVPVGSERGGRAFAVSGEWRFPIWLAHRGLGVWPAYLDRVAGAVFVDLAGAAARGEGNRTSWRTVSSVGLEVVMSHSLLFEGLDRIRVGVALPVEAPGRTDRSPSLYLQTGWSF